MKREPDFAIISRIEVGVREPGVDTPNLSGQVVYSLVRTDVEYLGEGGVRGCLKGRGPQLTGQSGRGEGKGDHPNNTPPPKK